MSRRTSNLRKTPARASSALVAALEARQASRKLTCRGAARAMGVSHTNYQNWTKHGLLPHLFFMPEIATFLGINLAEATRLRSEMRWQKRHGEVIRG